VTRYRPEPNCVKYRIKGITPKLNNGDIAISSVIINEIDKIATLTVFMNLILFLLALRIIYANVDVFITILLLVLNIVECVSLCSECFYCSAQGATIR